MNEEVHRRTEELEEANASLSAEKERLMVTLQSIGDGIVVTNTQREIVVFNEAAETLFRTPRQEALGQTFDAVVRLWSGKGSDEVENPVQTVMGGRSVVTRSRDVYLVQEDGASIEVSYSCAPILKS